MTIDTVYLIANEATCADELTKKVIFNDEISSFKLDNSIRIIHFNDVYNIESGPIEPKAGAARFLTAINYIKEKYPNTLVFFSGDAFSPSSSKIKS
jgi:2',3'-cyclic-nucleotide 2'-phosphodiesterase (5'-nucleotidase family)